MAFDWGNRRVIISLGKLSNIKPHPCSNITNKFCGEEFKGRFANVWSRKHDIKESEGNMLHPIFKANGSATTHLYGCFCSSTLSLNIALNMLPSDSFVSWLDSLLGYSTVGSRLCNKLPLRCLVLWINRLTPVCWFNFWKSSFKW